MAAATKTPVDLMFRAFSDPIRLRILALVQPTISRHLAYLRRARLVSVRQESPWNYYALAPAKAAFHAKLLECLESCFRDVPQLTIDATRAKALRKQSGRCAV